MSLMVNYFGTVEALSENAGGALSRVAQPSLHDRIEWFRLMAAHIGQPPGLAIASCQRDDGAQCWLPLVAKGPGMQGWTSWYTLQFRPIWAGVRHDVDKLALLTTIARSLRTRCGTVTLYPVPIECGTADLIATAFAEAGWHIRREDTGTNWIADTATLDFDRYWAARPSRLRNTTRRKARQAALDIRIHDRFDSLAWADYEAVYAASWKPEEGSTTFVRAMAEREGEAGTLRLGIAYSDGAPVACQLWLVERKTAVIHKLSYAENAKPLSPGTILSEAMFRHVITHDRPDRIDFGTGDDGYKADWMDRKLPLARMTMANPRHISGLALLARTAIRRLVQPRNRKIQEQS